MSPLLLALIAAALFGASAPAAKYLVSLLSPFELAGLLYFGAALGVAPLISRDKFVWPWSIERANKLRLIGALACGGVAAPVLLMVALQMASAATVSMWLCLEAPFTAILAWLCFKEHLGKFGWLAVLGTSLAVVMLSSSEGMLGIPSALAAVAACLLWGIDNNLTAVIDGLTPTQITFFKGLVAGAVNLSLASLLGGGASPTAPITMITILTAIGVGALCYGLSLTLYIKAAQKLGAMRSQMIFASAPFWGVAFSVAALGERLHPLQLLAGAVFMVSLLVLFKDRHGHAHIHEKMAHAHEHSHNDGHHDHVHSDNLADSLAVNLENSEHSHWHTHEPIVHTHPHWPDLHHRHTH